MKNRCMCLISLGTQLIGLVIYSYMTLKGVHTRELLMGIIISFGNIVGIIYSLRAKPENQQSLLYWMLACNLFYVLYHVFFLSDSIAELFMHSTVYINLMILILLGMKAEKDFEYYKRIDKSISRDFFREI